MEVEILSRDDLISETKKLYKENYLLNNKLSTLWDSVKILITKISHEMKTPLNSIYTIYYFFRIFIHETKNCKLL